MAPFAPWDDQLFWDIDQVKGLIGDWNYVFGSPSVYEAYLFCWTFRQLEIPNLLGAGNTEKEVEDLVASSPGRIGLMLVDGISKDLGMGLVRRVRETHPDARAILLINSLNTYKSNRQELSVFNGLVSAGSIGKGGLLKCLEMVQRGEQFIDYQLLEAKSNEPDPWNELNQRERSILPLLARGLKNKEIASELFIAETTTRDYVSSILSKLQVSNRAAAAAWAIEHGLTGG